MNNQAMLLFEMKRQRKHIEHQVSNAEYFLQQSQKANEYHKRKFGKDNPQYLSQVNLYQGELQRLNHKLRLYKF